MKKIIIAFGIGQMLQIILLWLAERITYSNNVFGFCVVGGVIVLIAVVIGAEGSLIELAALENAQTPEVKVEQAEKKESAIEVIGRIFPSWTSHRDIEDMDEADELPKEVQVTNSNVKRVDQ